MRKFCPVIILIGTLFYGSTIAPTLAEVVTVNYEAEAATVTGSPFGLTIPRLTLFTGAFSYDTSVGDTDPSMDRGLFPHSGGPLFTANFNGHTIHGSSTPLYEVSNSRSFRISDGRPQIGDNAPMMSIDNASSETLELYLSITGSSGAIPNNSQLPNPFPEDYHFGFLGTPHTFSIRDDLGTVLLQITDIGLGLPCDFIGAVGCDINDIDALYTGTGTAPITLTEPLITKWLTDASSTKNPLKFNQSHIYKRGDVDLDGDVDSVDLGVLLNNFDDSTGLGWGSGNFNTDVAIDSIDLGMLLNNFNFSSASLAVAVPEPNGLLWLLFGILACFRACKSR